MTPMQYHLALDIIAYIVSAWFSLKLFPAPKRQSFSYYAIVIVGFIGGAILFGSLNTYLSLGSFVLSKSIIGALFGGIVAVEGYKHYHDMHGSTGAYFVPSLAVGIMIGRIGCFMGGLDDFTYGTPTDSIFGYDFGDGVLRHPVQLYESVAMGIFLVGAIMIYRKNRTFFAQRVFYLFILYYACVRFVLEYFKPYADIVGGINVFQVLALIMIGYSVYFLRSKR